MRNCYFRSWIYGMKIIYEIHHMRKSFLGWWIQTTKPRQAPKLSVLAWWFESIRWFLEPIHQLFPWHSIRNSFKHSGVVFCEMFVRTTEKIWRNMWTNAAGISKDIPSEPQEQFLKHPCKNFCRNQWRNLSNGSWRNPAKNFRM